jgi:hypothetical protein
MPVRQLPAEPSLDHLKHQAKSLLRDHAAHIPASAQRLREFHPRFAKLPDTAIFAARLTLSAAQCAIAREHGFPSWPRLKRHIEAPTLTDRLDLPHHERIEDPNFRRAVQLIDHGDLYGLLAQLKQHPELVYQHVVFEGRNYFRNPSLLEFIAENPIRRGIFPTNILAIARAILEAGADQASRNETLTLVATGSVARERGQQIPLIDLLCDHGADPNAAAHAAALHDEPSALEALIRRGARIDLPIAAALARLEDVARLLPGSSPHDRHLALALAAQYGHIEIVHVLLAAGEDPNRYNPVGGHSHATPLHQAAGAGNQPLVHLLLEHGARLDLEDVLWHGTPADWAAHEGHPELAQYLHQREKTALPERSATRAAVTS